jgi:hypothetical protein
MPAKHAERTLPNSLFATIEGNEENRGTSAKRERNLNSMSANIEGWSQLA